MVSNILYVGSAVMLQSEWYTWLQAEHGSIINQKWSYANSHQVGGKSLENFFDLHQGIWNFLG